MTAEQRAEYRRHLEGMRSHFLGLMAILKKDEAEATQADSLAKGQCPRCNGTRYVTEDQALYPVELPRYGPLPKPCPLCSSARLERDAAQDDPYRP